MVEDYRFKNPGHIEFNDFKRMMMQDPTPSPDKLLHTPIRFGEMMDKALLNGE
jgi:hypothetical protein